MEQPVDVEDVTVEQRLLLRFTVLVKHRVALVVHFDQVVLGTQLELDRGIERLVAGDKLDRVAGHDVLKREQNQRHAQKYRNELQHTFNNVLSHITPLS